MAVERLHYSILMSYSLAHIGMTGEFASILRHLLLHVIYDMFLFPLGSIYTTLAISTERYITVCHPFFKISHTWSAKRYLIPILILSISYNIPKFFELEVHEETGILKSLLSFNNFPFVILFSYEHTWKYVSTYSNTATNRNEVLLKILKNSCEFDTFFQNWWNLCFWLHLMCKFNNKW